ncbi:MAG: hypothetical protein R3F39_06000 [Myxococcota bacterium]
MAKQVNLFLHPDDQAEFDRLLRSFGDVGFVPEFQRSAQVATVPDSLAPAARVDVEGSRLLLLHPDDVNSLRLVPSGDHWLVDLAPLSAVHFDRSVLRDDRIVQGRLYFEPRYVRDGQRVDKPAAFVARADQLLRGARRHLQRLEQEVGGHKSVAHIGAAALVWKKHHHATMRAGHLALIAASASDRAPAE